MSNNINKLQLSVKKYQKQLDEIKSIRDEINTTKYNKDHLLCQIIELSQAPIYLKPYDMFNYKSLLLYFMRNFTNHIKINPFNDAQDMLLISNPSNLFHLLNIPNKSKFLKEHKIHEKIIYDVLEFKNYGENPNFFKAKIASIGWVKETIMSPDFIYDKTANKAKKLGFKYLFVRKVGLGTKTQKYMYHLVGLQPMGKNRLVINSQFPIEMDRRYSHGENKVSRLHQFVVCNKPIFQKEGTMLPKDKDLNVDNLMRKFKDR